MKYSKMLILGLILTFIFVGGCEDIENGLGDESDDSNTGVETVQETNELDRQQNIESVLVEESEPEELIACTTHDDCDGEKCIDLVCGALTDQYSNTDCDATCRFSTVTIQTNDGQTHEMVGGKGSYTSAGALQWLVESGPKHCKTDETRVPIEVTKYNYGEKISQEYITLREGETSRILDHPTITSVAFSITIDDLTKECS